MNSTSATASTAFLGLSGEAWDFWVIVALVLTTVAAIGVAVATTGSVVSHKREARTADRALETYKAETASKVATANAAAERGRADAATANAGLAGANAEIEKAKARAADADARALEAKLALEQFKAPRTLTDAQVRELTELLTPYAGVPFDVSIAVDPESIALMKQIGGAMRDAGMQWLPVPGAGFTQPGYPHLGIVGFAGIAVQYDISRQQEWEVPAGVIWQALQGFGLQTEAKRITDGGVPPNAIHLYIGVKPH